MDDNDKLQEFVKRQRASRGFDTQVLSEGLEIAESLEDRDDRDYYVSALAEWAATSSEIKDLDRAIDLAQSVNTATDRCRALITISKQMSRLGMVERTRELVSAAEQAASQIDNGKEQLEWQKADYWQHIADVYVELPELDNAQRCWLLAVKWAERGQNSDDPQNAWECSTILLEIIKNSKRVGLKQFSLQIAQVISSEIWKLKALKYTDNN